MVWRQVLLISLATATAARAGLPPGSLDPSFDPGAGPTIHGLAFPSALLVLPDDRVIISGTFNVFDGTPVPALIRLQADGSLDPSFHVRSLDGSNALLGLDVEGTDSLVVDSSGRLVVAGVLTMSDGLEHRVFRLHPDGAIDATFQPLVGGESPFVRKVLSQPDGKVIVLGQFDTINGVAAPHLARLNSNGKLDLTFKPAHADYPSCMGLQSDGKLVLGMHAPSPLVVRLNADGSNDETFTPPPLPSGQFSQIRSLHVQPDDKILLTTLAGRILRLMPDGTVDATFHARAGAIEIQALQRDGRILILSYEANAPRRLNADGTADLSLKRGSLGAFMGEQSDGRLISLAAFQKPPCLVRRLSPDGVVDASFRAGEGGIDRYPGYISDGLLLPDGEVLVSGLFDHVGEARRQDLARFNRDGTLDTAFDAGAQIQSGSIRAVAADRSGTVFVSYFDATAAAEVIARLSDKGNIEASFPIPYGSFGVRFMAIPQNGTILVAGEAGLAEFNQDGSLGAFDPSLFYEVANKRVYRIALQTDGKIIAAMSQLRRFSPSGALDLGYNETSAWFDKFAGDFALQPDDKLVVAPESGTVDPPPPLVRINQDGTVDNTFEPGARRVLRLAVDASAIYGTSLVSVTQPPNQNYVYHYTMDRLLFSGAADPEFAPPEIIGAPQKILPQPDGQIIIIGDFTEVNGVSRNGLARLIGNAPRKLANISTRAQVTGNDGAEIGGFIVTGTAPKKVVIRGLGPSMQAAGVAASATLADPQLEVHDASGAIIGQNSDWQGSQQAEIVATGLVPANPLEAALVMTLQPGSYTGIVRGGTGESGLALVEIYDLDGSADSTLANISTRGVVGLGDAALIGGFILHGSGASDVVLRALGPSLSNSGVINSLADPVLELRNQDGELTASNDDWQSADTAEIEAAGLAPSNPAESAIAASLPPGSYTAVIHGKGSAVGIALFEAYRLP